MIGFTITFRRRRLEVTLDPRRIKSPAIRGIVTRLANHLSYLTRLIFPKRSGSHPISRYFRRLFENRRAGKVLGTNLALVALLTSFFGGPISAFQSASQEEVDVLAAQNPVLTTETSVQSPLTSYRISQGFHLFHPGVDLDQEEGALVRPILPGRVLLAEYSGFSFGNSVVIEHQSGFGSRYAHLGQIQVAVGDEVSQETILGTVGHTGWATGSHLHLEVYQEGIPINPAPLLPEENQTFLAQLSN